MSWTRFIEWDLYTFPTTNGYAMCCACSLGEGLGSYQTRGLKKFLAHVELHRKVGQRVPEWLPELIAKEWDIHVNCTHDDLSLLDAQCEGYENPTEPLNIHITCQDCGKHVDVTVQNVQMLDWEDE